MNINLEVVYQMITLLGSIIGVFTLIGLIYWIANRDDNRRY